MMKLSHRALIASLLWTVFVILLASKAEGKSKWSWTFILTPIWVIDIMTFVLIYVRRPSDTYTTNPLIYYCLAAKVAFQLLLVIRLDLFEAMPIYVIMSPLWCFLFMAATNLFQTIIIAPIDVN